MIVGNMVIVCLVDCKFGMFLIILYVIVVWGNNVCGDESCVINLIL